MAKTESPLATGALSFPNDMPSLSNCFMERQKFLVDWVEVYRLQSLHEIFQSNCESKMNSITNNNNVNWASFQRTSRLFLKGLCVRTRGPNPPPPARISTLLVDLPSHPCCVRTIWTAPNVKELNSLQNIQYSSYGFLRNVFILSREKDRLNFPDFKVLFTLSYFPFKKNFLIHENSYL